MTIGRHIQEQQRFVRAQEVANDPSIPRDVFWGPWGTFWKEGEVSRGRQICKQIISIIGSTIQEAKATGIPKESLKYHLYISSIFGPSYVDEQVYVQNPTLNKIEALRVKMDRALAPLFGEIDAAWSDTIVKESLGGLKDDLIDEVY